MKDRINIEDNFEDIYLMHTTFPLTKSAEAQNKIKQYERIIKIQASKVYGGNKILFH